MPVFASLPGPTLSVLLLNVQVRHVGVSNETSYGVMRFVQLAEQHNLPRIVSIQNCYNLLARGPFDTDLAEVCAPRQCNVGLLAYSPLAGGALSGKYVQGGDNLPNARFNMFPGTASELCHQALPGSANLDINMCMQKRVRYC